jgi:hypothetical protein
MTRGDELLMIKAHQRGRYDAIEQWDTIVKQASTYLSDPEQDCYLAGYVAELRRLINRRENHD